MRSSRSSNVFSSNLPSFWKASTDLIERATSASDAARPIASACCNIRC